MGLLCSLSKGKYPFKKLKSTLKLTTMKLKTKYNRMPLIILTAFSAIGLSIMGCTPVNNLSMSSNLASSKENEFIYENDTLAVEYRFDGYYRIAYVTIHNKLSIPLFVDWSRSSAIVNGEMFLYWTNDLKISASIHDPHNHDGEVAFSSTSYVNGSLQRTNPIGFISPFAYIKAEPKAIRNTYDFAYGDIFSPALVRPTYQRISNYSSYSPEQVEASLVFRNFLTLSTTSDFSTTFYVDKLFWANDHLSKGSHQEPSNSRRNGAAIQSVIAKGLIFGIASTIIFSVMGYTLLLF
jgi:hypothetical protein